MLDIYRECFDDLVGEDRACITAWFAADTLAALDRHREAGPEPELYYLQKLNPGGPPTDLAVWWRPKGCGYTTRLEEAGRYTAAVVARVERNGGSRGLPCSTVDDIARRAVLAEELPK